VYLIKAIVRADKVTNRAARASEALRIYHDMQTKSGSKSCAVFRRGVLVDQSELESAARREQN